MTTADEQQRLVHSHNMRSPQLPHTLSQGRIYSEKSQPSFFLTLCLLVLLGIRPKRLQSQLDSDDPKSWEDFREGLIKRWGTLGITSGLVLSAATTLLFSDSVKGASLVAAFACFCATIISISFGTALTFIFTDAPAHDFKALATRPLHMLFLLSIPNMFAMGSMVALYISITIFAWTFTESTVVSVLVKLGTTAGAIVMALLFAYAAWLVKDMGKRKEEMMMKSEWRIRDED
ncbi:hypothetical protein GYMLUDRAFT_243429 [Collybiopsis luxurians FD-317 M1]|uniref:Uncharacterized protein n=1 Tax=Collybiopsis luxurians FD-317 M1 TaxID=944289 RepID=A0A0D0CRC9_9AGAR|nr:hypothetical protein GYMLUDRAFT_243429 [Collybiopsis luxurians FD-317 M1]